MITLTCKICSVSFNPNRNKKTQKYCSWACNGASKRLSLKSCPVCKKEFKPKLSKTIYCSVKCSAPLSPAAQKGDKHPSWKGGIRRRPEGYRRNHTLGYIEIWIEGRFMGEHRLLMQNKLGRKLLINEHVHHINGIKNDNRLENLVVLTNIEHNKLHKPIQVKEWERNNKGQFIHK